MIKDQSVHEFLEALASKAATPGGGSAAAIMGAMGAALVSMVCNLTLGKKGYEAAEGEMQAVLPRAEALRERLADMVRADVEAFDQVMAAYGLPKDSEAQKAARGDAIQGAFKAATEYRSTACASVPRSWCSVSRSRRRATRTSSATPGSPCGPPIPRSGAPP